MAGLVLVVDDEEAIRELCRVNLELSGFEVVEAADGVDAVEQARRHRPDVIFLDIMMPRKDGWEALAELKGDPDTEGIPVVMLTAKRAEADQIRGWEAGILEYISKPFNPQALAEVAQRAMEPLDPDLEADRRQRILEQLEFVSRLRGRRSSS